VKKRTNGVAGEQTSASSASSTRASVGKVDLDPTAIELLIVEVLDGAISLGFVSEGDETEATRAAGFTIAHHD